MPGESSFRPVYSRCLQPRSKGMNEDMVEAQAAVGNESRPGHMGRHAQRLEKDERVEYVFVQRLEVRLGQGPRGGAGAG